MEEDVTNPGNEKAECPFSAQGEEVLNVKFFRGRRDDVITAAEILDQARSASMQQKMRTATRTRVAPISSHPITNVAEFVATL